VCRAAAQLLLTAGPPAVQQSIDISYPSGHAAAKPQQHGRPHIGASGVS